MKDVYSYTLHIEVDCGRGFKSVFSYSDSDKLYYGEKPKSSMETYDNQETVFDDLITIAGLWSQKNYFEKKGISLFSLGISFGVSKQNLQG